MSTTAFPGRIRIVKRYLREGDIRIPVYGYYDYVRPLRPTLTGKPRAEYRKTKGEGKDFVKVQLSVALQAMY